MRNLRKPRPGRFAISGVLAMAAATSLGFMIQRWMTYELLDVDGGMAAWCLAAALLAGMGMTTALLVGVPSYVLNEPLWSQRDSQSFGLLWSCVPHHNERLSSVRAVREDSFRSGRDPGAVSGLLWSVLRVVLSEYRAAHQVEAAGGLRPPLIGQAMT